MHYKILLSQRLLLFIRFLSCVSLKLKFKIKRRNTEELNFVTLTTITLVTTLELTAITILTPLLF